MAFFGCLRYFRKVNWVDYCVIEFITFKEYHYNNLLTKFSYLIFYKLVNILITYIWSFLAFETTINYLYIKQFR